MAMTSQEQKELRSYCAFLLKEYGFQFSPSDPVIPALYIIHKEVQLNNQNNKALATQVKVAASQISPQVFHFNVKGEAWKFQLGIAVKRFLYGLLVLLLLGIAAWTWSMANDIYKAKVILHASDNLGGLVKQVKKNEAGYFFIDFTAAQGDSIQHFTEFQKLNAKTVRVFLGKESKSQY